LYNAVVTVLRAVDGERPLRWMLRGQEQKAGLDPSRDTRVLIFQFSVLFFGGTLVFAASTLRKGWSPVQCCSL
jgi:hypothetical protein